MRIAAHRAQTDSEWEFGYLKKLAVAIREALEPFLKEGKQAEPT